MDPNSLVWILWVGLHSGSAAGACCAAPVQIEVPSIDLPTCQDHCKLSAFEICRAIGDANGGAAFSVTCMAKPAK
jgi:hypothetical protein